MTQVSPPAFSERSKSSEEIKAAEIVSACGARPLGTQRGFGATPDLFLFVDAHGSIVGVPLVPCRSEFVTTDAAGGVRVFPVDRPSVRGVGVDVAS
jgi:hypothetical protein